MTRAGDSDPLLGRVLDGKFTLLSVLGRGGMGVVYRAHQASLERSVALKLLMDVASSDPDHDDGSREQEFQRRFFLEAATAAKLKHPNTITVFDYGSTNIDDDRVFYITMELLDGVTLSKLLSRDGPLLPLRAVNIALQICRSLREAHGHGIVHRDLKPGNIMLVRFDHGGEDDADAGDDGGGDFVKVLDFGLAKTRVADGKRPLQLTKAGTFLGSPRYVAPEQIEGRPLDGRADIYSFGCVLYRMLTGRVPFDGQQAVEVMLKHLHDPVPPMNVAAVSIAEGGSPLALPKTLEDLVLKCLQKKASDRPASMDEVISTLKRARGEMTGVMSGNTLIPDDLASRMARGLVDPNTSGPVPAGATSTRPTGATPAPGLALQNSPSPLALTTLRQPVPKGEQTSPSQTSPSQRSSSSSSSMGPKKKAASSSQPSLNTPGPSTLGPPGPLSISGEWKIGPPPEESTRSTHGPNQAAMVEVPRRTPGVAIAGGVVVGLLLAGVGIAGRLGHLDGLMDAVVDGVAASDPPPAPRAPGPVAVGAANARLRIKTEPPGADVYDVTPSSSGPGAPRLLGITPLLVPWAIAAGDPSKELLLKLPGHVPARARVEPPPPSSRREPVTLDVEATLRPVAK